MTPVRYDDDGDMSLISSCFLWSSVRGLKLKNFLGMLPGFKNFHVFHWNFYSSLLGSLPDAFHSTVSLVFVTIFQNTPTDILYDLHACISYTYTFVPVSVSLSLSPNKILGI